MSDYTLSGKNAQVPNVDEFAQQLFQASVSTFSVARDYYERGLNVFPIPRPDEVLRWIADHPKSDVKPTDKPPYILDPLYYSRMHICTPMCKPILRHGKTPRPCLKGSQSFDELFRRANIAAMCGRTSGNLFAIDCDSQASFILIKRELDKRKIGYWAYKTHRGGMYLMLCKEGEVSNIPKDKSKYPDVEIWGRKHYVVMPPSIHPSGDVYMWETIDPIFLSQGESAPEVSIYDMEWLGINIKNKWEDSELVNGQEWTIYLSRSNRRILNSVLKDGQRNYDLTKPTYDIAAMIISDLIDYDSGLELLSITAERCDYPLSSVREMLNSALKKPNLSLARKNKVAPRSKEWEKALDFYYSYDWSVFGRKYQSRKAVFYACIKRSEMDHSGVFRATIREVAELANISKQTAQDALIDLRDKELIKLIKNPSNNYCLYGFGSACITRTLLPSCSCSVLNSHASYPSSRNEKDLFHRKYIAWQIWRYLLLHSEKDKASVARGINHDRSVVSRNIDWLMEIGLVEYDGTYFAVSVTDTFLGMIAQGINRSGHSENQERLHRIEREKRINQLLARARGRWNRMEE